MLAGGTSKGITDTGSKTVGALDVKEAHPLISCERGGRKVIMVSEFKDWDKSVKALRSRVEGVAETNPTLLLAHNPKAFLAASKLGIPLTLAGHTHGGQVARKGRPEVNLAVAHRLSAGFYHRDASTLFVTVGTGSWFPLRVQCPAEVVVLTCRRGEGEVRELGPEE